MRFEEVLSLVTTLLLCICTFSDELLCCNGVTKVPLKCWQIIVAIPDNRDSECIVPNDQQETNLESIFDHITLMDSV